MRLVGSRPSNTSGATPFDLQQERIAAARRRAPAEKLRDGLALFDRAIRVMADGVRHEHPEASPERVLEMLRERLRLARTLEGR